MSTVAVIDYGGSNLRSVVKALESVAGTDHHIIVADDARSVANADRVVFPGQGAIGDCMARLHAHGLVEVIRECTRTRPFLGSVWACNRWSPTARKTAALRAWIFLPVK